MLPVGLSRVTEEYHELETVFKKQQQQQQQYGGGRKNKQHGGKGARHAGGQQQLTTREVTKTRTMLVWSAFDNHLEMQGLETALLVRHHDLLLACLLHRYCLS